MKLHGGEKAKKTKTFLVYAFLSFILLINNAYAHKQSDSKPVHQWLDYQAFNIWPNDINHEIFKYLGTWSEPFDTYPIQDQRYQRYGSNITNIIKGAHDEDVYNPLSQTYFATDDYLAGSTSNFNDHFWDNGKSNIQNTGPDMTASGLST